MFSKHFHTSNGLPAGTVFAGQLLRFLLLFFWGVSYANAQTTETLVPQIPTSPQAASIGLYGDYAINYSTGTPDISVPLFEIEHRGYKMPVTLRYNPQPLKTGYNYDVYGQGWGLSVNSCISRSIEYEPDELTDFKVDTPPQDYLLYCGNDCLYNKNYAHDHFHVTLPNGTSFDFMIDNQYGQKVFIVSDDRAVKISYGMEGDKLTQFHITDEEGVKYTFEGSDTPYLGAPYTGFYVSWQLSRIDLPNSPDPILFTCDYQITSRYSSSCYEPVVQLEHDHTTAGNPTGDPALGGPDTYSAQKLPEGVSISYTMHLLSEISYGPGGRDKVLLIYKNATGQEFNYVKKIKLLEDNRLVNEIRLDMTVTTNNISCGSDLAHLDSISVMGTDTTASPLRYRFDYYPVNLAFGTDHWGYRNYSSPMDMPDFTLFLDWDWGAPIQALENAGMAEAPKTSSDVSPLNKFSLSSTTSYDLRRSAGPTDHGVLRKITYPTGGYTLFDFENHHFYTHSDPDGNYIPDDANRVISEGGGFRIRTIENYDASGVRTGKKSFRYGKTNAELGFLANPNYHTGAGEPLADPNILTYMDYSTYPSAGGVLASNGDILEFPFRYLVMGLNQYGQHQAFLNMFHYTPYTDDSYFWLLKFSPLNFRRVLNGRPAVLYDEVTVYDGDVNEDTNTYPLGKTVYKYNLKGEYPGDVTFEPPQYYGNMLFYEPKDFMYNKLVSKTDYRYDNTSSAFVMVKRESDTWQWSYGTCVDYQFMNLYPGEHHGKWVTANNLFTSRLTNLGTGRLMSKRTVDYHEDSGDSTVVVESYEYNNNGQLNYSNTINSRDESITTVCHYPEVPYTGPQFPAVQTMLDKNMVSSLIQKETTLGSSYQNKKTGTQTEYGLFNTGQVLPARQYVLESGTSGFQYVLRNEVKAYSANGNPTEVLEEGTRYKSYIWGYDDRYPVAEVLNASLANVAYTGFETNETGGWTYAGTAGATHSFTGNQGYLLSNSGVLSKTGLDPSASYLASICVYGSASPSFTGGTEISHTSEAIGQGWTRYQYVFRGAATLTIAPPASGSIWTDDACLHPLDAQMTTYTYEPLVGMTSQTDAAGHTTYYTYDGFRRLKDIKDQDRHLLKHYTYHYQNQ